MLAPIWVSAISGDDQYPEKAFKAVAVQTGYIPGLWIKATYWQAVVPLILEKVDRGDFESFEKS